MKLFNKFKELLTEEVEEEIKPIKKEVRHIEVAPVTRSEREYSEREYKPEYKEEKRPEPRYEEEKKEEKFVFFSDDDFKDLEPKREEIKKEIPKKEEKPLPYGGANPQKTVVEEKKPFKPSLIISPVYGVLDKNYTKDEIVSKKVTPTRSYSSKNLSLDDVRNKAYGTVEDELKDTLFGNFEEVEEPVKNDINIFEELEKYDELDKLENRVKEKDNGIENIFDELDNKKDAILDELDNKKDEIIDELKLKKDDIIETDNIDELDLDDETLELSRQLENQKRNLDEINGFLDENNDETDDFMITDKEEVDEELNESELFDLIDSMYDKKDDE